MNLTWDTVALGAAAAAVAGYTAGRFARRADTRPQLPSIELGPPPLPHYLHPAEPPPARPTVRVVTPEEEPCP